MSRRCPVTGTGVLVGNNVSHANNKTRRRFLPNLQETSFYSDKLKRNIQIRVSTKGIRTIEFHGGLDAYLQKTSARHLSKELARLKKVISA